MSCHSDCANPGAERWVASQHHHGQGISLTEPLLTPLPLRHERDNRGREQKTKLAVLY